MPEEVAEKPKKKRNGAYARRKGIPPEVCRQPECSV